MKSVIIKLPVVRAESFWKAAKFCRKCVTLQISYMRSVISIEIQDETTILAKNIFAFAKIAKFCFTFLGFEGGMAQWPPFGTLL